MGQAIKESYSDLFLINENLSEKDREAVVGKFKSALNSSDRVADLQAMTFFALLKHADLSAQVGAPKIPPLPSGKDDEEEKEENQNTGDNKDGNRGIKSLGGLRYNIEIHLPATKDIEVFHAIFRSLKENLLDD
jgi:hypothetical protein